MTSKDHAKTLDPSAPRDFMDSLLLEAATEDRVVLIKLSEVGPYFMTLLA